MSQSDDTVRLRTNLTRHNEPVHWDASQQIAFNALRCKLTQATPLLLPNEEHIFVVVTGISNVVMGAVLTQNAKEFAARGVSHMTTQRRRTLLPHGA